MWSVRRSCAADVLGVRCEDESPLAGGWEVRVGGGESEENETLRALRAVIAWFATAMCSTRALNRARWRWVQDECRR